MKEGFDKEIDSLLRRRARGAAKSYADGEGALASASAHLDADELGAFAEGALPAPARLAAASHLADCDRCRGVAVALSRALGGGAEVKQAAAIPASTAAKAPASWGAWVAALFSPRVLRYAAPVLALSVVAVVSFVALRTRDGGALNNTMSARPQADVSRARPEAAGSAGIGTATTNDNQSGLVAQNSKDSSAGNDSKGTTPRQPSEGRGPNVGEAPAVSPGSDAPAPVRAEDAAAPPPAAAVSTEAPPEMAKTATRPVVEERESAPAKSDDRDKQKSAREPETADEVAANDLAVQQQRRAAQNRAAEVQMPDGSRNQRRDGNVSNIYGGNAGASAAQPKESDRDDRAANAARRGRSSTRGEQRQELNETARGGETREAAGHRFRREGSAWVDVKYKSSMSSTGVRRGTETFRALVADLPVIGRVAEQLSGEVIVVVNGRAYRIR